MEHGDNDEKLKNFDGSDKNHVSYRFQKFSYNLNLIKITTYTADTKKNVSLFNFLFPNV